VAKFLWRENPRFSRYGWVSTLTNKTNSSKSGDVYTVEFFGIFSRGQITIGQGTATSDISASASTPAAAISTGQGSITSDLAANLNTDGVIDAGQGSITSDGAGLVPLPGTIDAGQGDITTDISAAFNPFRAVLPTGWWDNANYITQPGQSFYQLSPRSSSNLIWKLATIPVVVNEQFTLHPYNVYSDGVGAHVIAYTNQTTYPSGIAPGSLGTPTVRNQYEYVSPTGISGGAFGTAVVYNLTQYITTTGSLYEAFGTQSLALGTFPQTLHAVGWFDETYGTQDVRNRNSYILQGVTSVQVKFGTQKVENFARLVRPSGLAAGGIGTPSVSNYIRYINCTGWKSDTLGTPVIFGPQYANCHGWDSALYGVTYVDYFNRHLYPAGIEPIYSTVDHLHKVENRNRYIYMDGIDPPDMFGAIVAIPPFDIIDVTDNSIDAGDITSTAAIYYKDHNRILCTGFTPTTFGTIKLTPRWVTVKGATFSGYGKPTVSNYIRYLRPTGFIDDRFGTQWASFYIRNVYPVGFDRSRVWDDFGPVDSSGRTANVSPGPITIAPAGFEGSGNTYDNCGFPRMPGVPRPTVHR